MYNFIKNLISALSIEYQEGVYLIVNNNKMKKVDRAIKNNKTKIQKTVTIILINLNKQKKYVCINLIIRPIDKTI